MNSMIETKFSVTNLKNLYIFEFFIQPFITQAVLIVKWLATWPPFKKLSTLWEHPLEENSFHFTNIYKAMVCYNDMVGCGGFITPEEFTVALILNFLILEPTLLKNLLSIQRAVFVENVYQY